MPTLKIVLLLSFLAVSGQAAMDQTPLTEPKSSNPVVPPERSPAVQMLQLQGTVIAIDTIYQRMKVQSPTGEWGDFLMSTTTPISYYFAPIGFRDLHLGDQVVVTYSSLPFVIHRVDKL